MRLFIFCSLHLKKDGLLRIEKFCFLRGGRLRVAVWGVPKGGIKGRRASAKSAKARHAAEGTLGTDVRPCRPTPNRTRRPPFLGCGVAFGFLVGEVGVKSGRGISFEGVGYEKKCKQNCSGERPLVGESVCGSVDRKLQTLPHRGCSLLS